jgi:gamma-glutamylcysteine synthetase
MKDFIQTAAAGRSYDTRNQFHDLRYTSLARAFWRWRWKCRIFDR